MVNAQSYPFLPTPVTFTTTAKEVVPAQAFRRTIMFRNVGAYDCYIAGFAGVTNSAGAKPGLPIKAGETLQLLSKDGDSVESSFYGISDTGDSLVMVITT